MILMNIIFDGKNTKNIAFDNDSTEITFKIFLSVQFIIIIFDF